MTSKTLEATKLAFDLALKRGLDDGLPFSSLRAVPILWPALEEIEREFNAPPPPPPETAA